MLDYLPVGLNWGYMTLVQAVDGRRPRRADGAVLRRGCARADRNGARHLHPDCAGVDRRDAQRPGARRSTTSRSLRDRDHRRRLGGGRDDQGVPGGRSSRQADRALRHARDRLSHLSRGSPTIPLKVNGTVGRLRRLDGFAHDRRRRRTTCRTAKSARSPRVGPSVHIGYLDNPTANRDSFTADGWFRTGDLGRYADARRQRAHRGTQEGDHQPRRQEISSRARSRSCSTSTRRSSRRRWSARPIRGWANETACARSSKEGSSLTLDEVVAFLKGRVADYKLPEALVVMQDFPMTPTGKIRRPELVKRVSGNRVAG